MLNLVTQDLVRVMLDNVCTSQYKKQFAHVIFKQLSVFLKLQQFDLEAF